MTVVLQIANRSIAAEEILPLLAGYKMLPQFIEELLIDAAIASIESSPEEIESARQQYYAQNQITDPEARQNWLARYGMTTAQLEAQATRELRIEKFKQQTWGGKLESYFLGRKAQLDRVIYSLIRTQDVGISQELYFRILEGEQSFGALARQYSKGPEAQTEGLIGPVELSVPHPILAQLLAASQPGQVNPPTRVGEWIVLVRLEKFIPAQMDDAMRRRLLNECFDNWLRGELEKLGSLVPAAPLSVSQPNSAQADLSQPNLSQPNSAQANLSQPNLSQSDLSQPNLSQPNSAQLSVAQDKASQTDDASPPSTAQTDASQTDVRSPAAPASDSSASEPSTAHPATASPTLPATTLP